MKPNKLAAIAASALSIDIIYFTAAATAASDENCAADDLTTHSSEYNTCGLYLARSTIPNSGLGIFTGIPHDTGSICAPPEIAHQILFEFDDVSKTAGFAEYAELAYDYVWQSYVTGGSSEGKRVESLIPGLGMAANSFLPMVNSRSLMGKIDSAGINTEEMGPGSGAFSAYYDITYLAQVPMKAGEEIFVDYGDNYFRGRPQRYGAIPLAPEFKAADEMLAPLWVALQTSRNIKQLFDEKDDNIQQELQILWHVIRNSFVSDERVRNALPSSIEDLPRASMYGAAHNFLRGDNPRSLKWLETNGYCMDTLSVRKSAIPQAGRGAFAKRGFNAGETILPMPLIQMDRRSLHVIKRNTVHSHQLILNYCFGHKDSSLLLYPYSSTSNFINHGEKEANAKVVWAKEGDRTGFHEESWLSSTPENIMEQSHTGLLMMLVATRDIAKDEEVLIDYGSEWEDAWDEHVNSWSSDNMQRSAAELNDSETQLRTVFEEPYPMMPYCHYQYVAAQDTVSEDPHGVLDENDNDEPEELKKKLPLIEASARTWHDIGMSGRYLRPCIIFARYPGNDTGGDTYLVQMFNQHQAVDGTESIPSDQKHYVKGVPRKAILFADSSHTSNQQNVKAFRHEIGFPDNDIWPESWRDLGQ